MKRYEKYKPSGVEWLGEVPEHWEIKPLKFAVSYNDETLPENTDLDKEILYVDISSVSLTDGIKNKELMIFENAPSRARRIIKDGDVLVSTVRTYLKAIAQVESAEPNLIASTGFAVLRSKCGLNSQFLGYYIQSEGIVGAIVANSVGVSYPAINASDLVRLPICIPSETEQAIIANFLDKKTEKIDRLISHQQALLEKLSEKRTALITETVCGRVRLPTALNDNETLSGSNAPLRNSGIEWLGEVPEHWETWKITHLINLIGSGTTPKSDNPDYYDGNTLWVTTSELRENYISDTKQKISQEALNDHSALKIYPPNSVAIAMYGATIGRLGILEKEATFNQACCIFSPSKKLHHKFLFYWLWHRRPILISLSNGGGQPNLSQDDLKKIKLAIPSYEEQTTIVNYLDTETAKIDRLQHKIERVIERLKEYRSALITQVVTGKVKV